MPSQLPMTNYQLPRPRRGFTLIELMVVVALIAVLISILVPTLSFAKRRAKITETTAQLTGLSSAIDQYFQVFDAYPGPARSADTTLAAAPITGTQNLMLGLFYAMVPSTDINVGTKTSAMIAHETSPNFGNPTGTITVDVAKTSTVNDYSNITNDSNNQPQPRSYPAFYSPKAAELSAALPSPPAPANTWPAGGVTGKIPTAWTFPVLLDRFNDALPILYYRRTPGVDGTATIDPTTGIWTQPGGTTAATAAICASNPASSTNISSYYLAENTAYTSANALTASSGLSFDETTGSFSDSAAGPIDFATATSNASSTSANARGGYVLISAGPDRIYGRVKANGAANFTGSKPSDDIVIVGGH